MRIRFLLGPAGSGKTFRCLSEIREALLASPEGDPLILLAPKQATFQVERQLLGEGALAGYTRLRILSFDRLARFVFELTRKPEPRLLNEEGRVMVLRGLLSRNRETLKLFRASARLTGFAQQLSVMLRELQQAQLAPALLSELAGRMRENTGLSLKLEDLAILLQAYQAWLDEHNLRDAECILNSATAALREGFDSSGASGEMAMERGGAGTPAIDGLWLDGFAEFSAHEMDLLTALLPLCRRVTLAFCVDPETKEEVSWLSHWAMVRRTVDECRKRLARVPGAEISVERLPRDSARGRFRDSAALGELERRWGEACGIGSMPTEGQARAGDALQMVTCANPEGEAVMAAREILRFVRCGGRFREASVLVRKLEGYHSAVQRVFERYEIPHFLDRREPVAHHPLAELTRSALRLVALQWPHDDWFAALKTGLVPAEQDEVDRLENEALARGWKGATWQQPITIADNFGLADELERVRRRIVPPFQHLALRLGAQRNRPGGAELADVISDFWSELKVEERLEEWATDNLSTPQPAFAAMVHTTVWTQMCLWLDNLRLAFGREALPLREWLPIVDAGLVGLTVGVIPPALDQVLVGAVDRSRNPDIRLALVLGMNETVFPMRPESPVLLSDTDRTDLEKQNVMLGSTVRRQLGRERYYAYIACTRARERLVLACSASDENDQPLNPSPFLLMVQRLFPELKPGHPPRVPGWGEIEHSHELIAPLMSWRRAHASSGGLEREPAVWQRLAELPELASVIGRFDELGIGEPVDKISAELVDGLYGRTLRTSVSRLEEFASCPFRFFVHSGLRAEERQLFDLDAREQGSFQHDALRLFHEGLQSDGKRWRDLTPEEARTRMAGVTRALAATYRGGLLQASDRTRFTARMLSESLQNLVATLVCWARDQYQFDPVAVELPFGEEGVAPAWELDLGSERSLALRGRIDRVDLWRGREGGEALCVVIDYKSSAKQLDPILVAHGVQLQLLSYLNVLRHWPTPRETFGTARLLPAGVFYVALRGKYERAGNRDEALAEAERARRLACRHTGRFDAGVLSKLDSSPDVRQGDQFNYRRNTDGSLRKGSREALSGEEFENLLRATEEHLKRMGREIFEGTARLDPYRKGAATACDHCGYKAICRIDPWTHAFRVLRPADQAE